MLGGFSLDLMARRKILPPARKQFLIVSSHLFADLVISAQYVFYSTQKLFLKYF
jgi:hypothetical protein